MTCKKCGADIYHSYYWCVRNPSDELPTDVSKTFLEVYKDYPCAYYCDKCDELIDYKDMDTEMFFSWLNRVSELESKYNCDPTLKGKALIRYFDLDKLLLQKACK